MSAHAWGPDDVLSMWTVIREPTDMPGVAFVARRWEIRPGRLHATSDVVTGRCLAEVRAALAPLGLVCTSRHSSDPPNVVEVWL